MTSGCLLWLLVVLLGVCWTGLAEHLGQVEPRATRQICGNDFDSMYFAGACDLGRKRSAWPPLGPVEPQFQLYYPTSDWESVPADLGRLENSLVHRLARSVWFGQQRPRPRLTPASARHPVWKHQRASKRSPAHYRRLHDLCCGKGCSEAHFVGIC